MGFTLKDKHFEIKRAEISATILDPYWLRKYHPKGDSRLFWSLELEIEGELEDEECSAVAAVEEMRFPIRQWTDILGQTMEWNGPFDEKAGVPNGRFYLYYHEQIRQGKLCFTERDGVRFKFEWKGLCDVLFSDEYGRDVPFLATGWAEFTGVGVNGSASDTSESLLHRLAENLDPRGFRQGTLHVPGHRYDSGVKMCSAVFTPIEPASS